MNFVIKLEDWSWLYYGEI